MVWKSCGSRPVPGSGATGARWNACRRRATRSAIAGSVICSGVSGRISSHASMRPLANVPKTYALSATASNKRRSVSVHHAWGIVLYGFGGVDGLPAILRHCQVGEGPSQETTSRLSRSNMAR